MERDRRFDSGSSPASSGSLGTELTALPTSQVNSKSTPPSPTSSPSPTAETSEYGVEVGRDPRGGGGGRGGGEGGQGAESMVAESMAASSATFPTSSSATFPTTTTSTTYAGVYEYVPLTNIAPMNARFFEDDPLYLSAVLAFVAANVVLGGLMLYEGLVDADRCGGKAGRDAPLFLRVAGAVALSTSAAKVLHLLCIYFCRRCASDHDTACETCRPLICFCAEVGVLIWGSCTLLPAYPESPASCSFPWDLSFAVIVFNWCLLPLQGCSCFIVLCAALLRTAFIFNGKAYLAGAGAL